MKKIYLQMLTLCLLLLASVSVNAETVTAKWDFKNDVPSGIRAATNYQGVEADVQSDVDVS
ncbi:MAG: hypothetical protein II541_09565 [Prevotella sp.]|nr:hypothetical protein [Prevotella sp.]